MIDSQVRKLLFYIDEHENVMAQTLADEFDVSDRTIRTYVKSSTGNSSPPRQFVRFAAVAIRLL